MWINPRNVDDNSRNCVGNGTGKGGENPAPGVTEGASWADSSGISGGICAPGTAEELWKRTFLMETKLLEEQEILKEFLGIQSCFFQKEDVCLGCLRVQKIFLF